MYGHSWPLKIGNNWLCRRTVWHAETNWDEFTFKSKIELVWKNCNKSYEIIWFASAVGGRSMNDYSPGKLNRKVILTEWRFGATIYVYFISLNTYFFGTSLKNFKSLYLFTTFSRHKWPFTKMHTTSDAIFWHKTHILCPFIWCDPFCFKCVNFVLSLRNYFLTSLYTNSTTLMSWIQVTLY